MNYCDESEVGQSIKDLSHVVGIKQTLRSLEQGKAKTVYLAEDCEPRLLLKVAELARELNVELVMIETMSELGRMAGLKIESAAAAVLK